MLPPATRRAGLVKYEMTLDRGGPWIETGAVARDEGTGWFPIFEMKPKRVT